ncbi:hypothetical protein FGLOB1_430 [Fusarium globosum]|uniref:Uncharacterized protein n=1 Tax=Fusarium globosum TaxID=78864 RepID=A0A8H5YYM7_9HYPO|nr:hypothetical protein FGLOB1_430 [Fusarium globosum]
MQPYPYPKQKVNVSRSYERHADPEILLEYIKEGVTEESNYSEFKIQLEVPRESEIVCHNTTHVERFYEETDPTRKAIHRIEGAVQF